MLQRFTVIKKFTRPVRITGARSKITGLEQTGNGTACSVPVLFLLHLRAKFYNYS